MNSKDLRAIEHVQRLVEIGIDSLKIEGVPNRIITLPAPRKLIAWRLTMHWQAVHFSRN